MFTLLILASSAYAQLRPLDVTSLRAEKEDSYSMADDMKMSVYGDLQDWQLKAIVKAAPEQMNLMEAKLEKKKAECSYRRRFGLWDSVGAGVNTILRVEGETAEEQEKKAGKKMKKYMKKVDKMKTEELLKAMVDIDGELKKIAKKIKKISKKC